MRRAGRNIPWHDAIEQDRARDRPRRSACPRCPGGNRTRLEFIDARRADCSWAIRARMPDAETRGEGVISMLPSTDYAPITGRPSRRAPQFRRARRYRKTGEAVELRACSTRRSAASCLSAPGERVYAGMVVGREPAQSGRHRRQRLQAKARVQHARNSAAADEALQDHGPPRSDTSLEQAMEWINDDELVEITPTHIRIRKKELDAANRLRAAVRARNAQK